MTPQEKIQALKESGWSFAAIARAVGASERSVHNWREGIRPSGHFELKLKQLKEPKK